MKCILARPSNLVFYHLRNTDKICSFLSYRSNKSIAHAFISSCLAYSISCTGINQKPKHRLTANKSQEERKCYFTLLFAFTFFCYPESTLWSTLCPYQPAHSLRSSGKNLLAVPLSRPLKRTKLLPSGHLNSGMTCLTNSDLLN